MFLFNKNLRMTKLEKMNLLRKLRSNMFTTAQCLKVWQKINNTKMIKTNLLSSLKMIWKDTTNK